MRRVYTKKSNAKEQALRQLRETRAKLTAEHPELMKVMREHVQKMQKAGMLNLAGESVKPNQEKPSAPQNELLIDKQKNISTVLKLLEDKDDKSTMNKAIKALLLKYTH